MVKISNKCMGTNQQAIRKRIRTRASYSMFMKMAQEIGKKGTTVEDVLDLIHDTLDNRHSYKSYRNSRYAEESLILVKEDLAKAREV